MYTEENTSMQRVAQYLFEWCDVDGKYYARIKNTNAKPYNQLKENYRFTTVEQRDAYLKEKMQGVKDYETKKKERKQARKEVVNPAQVGDILNTSWGYEQTNVEFYKVVKVTAKTVTVVELKSRMVEGTGFMSRTVEASTELRNNKEITRRVRPFNDGDYAISIEDYIIATKWSGRPTTETSYA